MKNPLVDASPELMVSNDQLGRSTRYNSAEVEQRRTYFWSPQTLDRCTLGVPAVYNPTRRPHRQWITWPPNNQKLR